MKYLKQNTLYCFSPPVMLATFCIEIVLAVHTFVKYRLSRVTAIAIALFACLAVFQLAEFNVCEGSWGIGSADWSRFGYIAITLLPPLGIHLCAALANDNRKWPVLGAYAAGLLFASYFLWESIGAESSACLGNYVIFHHGATMTYWYAAYYYGLLVAGVAYALLLAAGSKKRIKWALYAVVFGYSAFIIPTTFVNIVSPSTIEGIPSIMCGFAVIFAVTLAAGVLPRGDIARRPIPRWLQGMRQG